MTTTSIIIPALDEAENLPKVLYDLALSLYLNHHADTEIIVVAGTMNDRRAADVDYGHGWPTVHAVGQTRTGKGNALACGMHVASGKYIVMMDADGSHTPADVLKVMDALKYRDHSVEFVKASRFLPSAGSEDFTPIRRLGAWALTLLHNFIFGTKHSDLCYGLMGFRADMLLLLGLPDVAIFESQWGDGFEIETLINCRMAQAKATTTEVPSVECSRRSGESHLRPFGDGLRILRTMLAERRRPRADNVIYLNRRVA